MKYLEDSTSIPVSEMPYEAMSDVVLDEENINWCVLFLRVFAIIILVGIIICVGIGTIEPKFYLLAAIASIGLVLFLIVSFFRLQICSLCNSRYVQRMRRDGYSSNSRNISQEETRNPMRK